jgi:hypothetical protein
MSFCSAPGNAITISYVDSLACAETVSDIERTAIAARAIAFAVLVI